MERTPSDLATPTVLKFGGTSVEDAAACARVAGIVRAHGGSRPVVVVSALAGVIDMDEKRATSVLRLSPHYYNTVEELDRTVAELRELIRR